MKWLGKIVYGVFIAALAGVAALLLATLLPVTGNFEIKIVKSGSMEPAIPTGSLIVSRPSFAKATEGRPAYKPGDIIVFGQDTATQIPTTHRVVSVRHEGGQTFYQTKGDANEEADPREIAANEILGEVIFSVPYAGYILDFARQPTGFALLIGVPAALIVLDEGVNIFKEVTKLRKRRKLGVAVRQMPVPQKPTYYAEYAHERTRIPTI